MNLRLLAFTAAGAMALGAMASPEVPDSISLSTLTAITRADGGISAAQLQELRESFKPTVADRAVYNAISN
ncbi:MAG: hypothetical protein K2N66_06855, partial [Paramuribaculum sp.]|nr:hypothetical protein [Paramuribaculum sp.]